MPFQHYGDQKHLPITPALRDYVIACTPGADSVFESLYHETSMIEDDFMRRHVGNPAGMMVPAEQAAFMTILTKTLSAKTIVDVGTYTGMSALAFARGLAPGGRVHTFDVTDRWFPIAHAHWAKAGVEDLIEFHLGEAVDGLRALPGDTMVDLAFIDADKDNYRNYYELVVPLLRPGGLLIVDNTLFNGYVLDPGLIKDPVGRGYAEAIREFNAAVAADPRMESVMLPLADGVTIARRNTEGAAS